MNNSKSKKIFCLLCILVIVVAGYFIHRKIFSPGDLIPAQQQTDSIVDSGIDLSGQQQTEVVQHGQNALNEARKIREQVRTDISNLDAVAVADGVRDELRLLLRERGE